MNVQAVSWLRVVFYLGAIIFYYLVFFTWSGNYFHGGTVLESVLLQAVAVVTLASGLALVRRVRIYERLFILLIAAVPAVGMVLSIVSLFYR